jgi:tetratricopeptide (TPR) repeat protein
MRLVSAQSGEELASFRETADNQSELLPTVDRLAKEVRAKIGESLKKIQNAPPLEQVTTSSLEALKKYVQGVKLINEDGDFTRGAELLEEAVALDTGFAMAYRKLGIEHGNRDLNEKAEAYYEKAFAHRDRLSDAERLLLVGSYYGLGKNQDATKAMAAYEQLLEIQPNNTAALNNLSTILLFTRQPARAESLLQRAIQVGPVASVHFNNLSRAQLEMGRGDSALTAASACIKAFPKNLDCQDFRGNVLWSLGRFDSAAATLRLIEREATSLDDRASASFGEAELARFQGRLDDATRFAATGYELARQAGVTATVIQQAVDAAFDEAWFRSDGAGAQRHLDEALARTPLKTVSMAEAPYEKAVITYAMAGRPDRARAVMTEWDARRRDSPTTRDTVVIHRLRGQLALASKNYAAAESELRITEKLGCQVCDLPSLGRAFDLGGVPDSAIAVYERYLTTLWHDRVPIDAAYLPAVHKRLGELYEAKGKRDAAVKHYRTFIELWKNADPVLQPKVTDAKQRVAALTKGTDSQK